MSATYMRHRLQIIKWKGEVPLWLTPTGEWSMEHTKGCTYHDIRTAEVIALQFGGQVTEEL